nr:uncharacterized protein CTRU02_12663 [Colletotrichum truncatum]KAF6784401.1 hypothetical protein CTRU02_12663 [Colletotrichum truncatum]
MSPIYIFHIAWALNFAADLMIFFLPFLILHKLQLKRSVKISVYCTFLLGIINLGFSLTRFLVLQLALTTSTLLPNTLIQLWSGLDVNVGLIIACLPTLRPYLSHARKARLSQSSNGADISKRSAGCSEVSGTPRQAEFNPI